MQNRYVGDTGDFGKYGLLRAICGYRENNEHPDLSLGIAWYLTPDESHNADGKHVSYLRQTRKNMAAYQYCDPRLYLELSHIVESNSRNISAIQQSRIFDQDTTSYFDEPLDYRSVTAPPGRIAAERLTYRQNWVQQAVDKLQSQQVIFLDPDKSLEPNLHPGHQAGAEYAFFEDIRAFTQSAHNTVVVYHHLNRSAPAPEQVRRKLSQTQDALGVQPTAMLYHRGSARAFIILPSSQHRPAIEKRIEAMMTTPWSAHFSLHRHTE